MKTSTTVKLFLATTFCLFLRKPCEAWSEGGHHLIAVIAFELLNESQQNGLLETLKAHPRFAEDFRIPDGLSEGRDLDQWYAGRAGYWPDHARRGPYDRPPWHFHLGASVVLGSPKNVPTGVDPLPDGAMLAMGELHICQAVQLCRSSWRDRSRPPAERALSLCWISHLVADAHQPCHAGSLYSEVAFPNGDRGANSIPTKQMKNLHALWDSLLGPKFDAGDVGRRRREILGNPDLAADAKRAADEVDGLDPLTWINESSELARLWVYTDEVIEPIEAVERKLKPKLTMIELSEEYLKAAGALAQKRAALAGYRLAKLIAEASDVK